MEPLSITDFIHIFFTRFRMKLEKICRKIAFNAFEIGDKLEVMRPVFDLKEGDIVELKDKNKTYRLGLEDMKCYFIPTRFRKLFKIVGE